MALDGSAVFYLTKLFFKKFAAQIEVPFPDNFIQLVAQKKNATKISSSKLNLMTISLLHSFSERQVK